MIGNSQKCIEEINRNSFKKPIQVSKESEKKEVKSNIKNKFQKEDQQFIERYFQINNCYLLE